MEFGTREILILLGFITILGILLDGVRRVKHSHKGTLRVSRRKQGIFEDDALDDPAPGELLTGVRVTKRDEQRAEEVSDTIKRKWESNADKCTSAFREIGRGNDSASNPSNNPSNVVSFQPVAPKPPVAAPPPPVEPPPPSWVEEDVFPVAEDGLPERPVSLSEFDIDDDGADDEAGAAPAPAPRPDQRQERWTVTREEPELDLDQPFHLSPPEAETHKPVPPREQRRKPFWEETPPVAPPQPPAPAVQSRTSEPPKPRPERVEPEVRPRASAESSVTPSPPPDAPAKTARPKSDNLEVVVLHVMAKKDCQFKGEELLDALMANGLRFGDMGIFHRHESLNGTGPVHFSLANSVKPGTFNLQAMADFTTPGVTLFMPLDGLKHPLDCFSELVKSAQNLAKALDGELKDETRSALTKQTIEHHRQQIIEYTRRSFTLSHP